MSVPLHCATQDEDGKSDCEPEESDGGAASGFVVADGYLSASEVRDAVDGDGDDAVDGDADGEPALFVDGRGHLCWDRLTRHSQLLVVLYDGVH